MVRDAVGGVVRIVIRLVELRLIRSHALLLRLAAALHVVGDAVVEVSLRLARVNAAARRRRVLLRTGV